MNYQVTQIDASAKAEFNARKGGDRFKYLALVVKANATQWANDRQLEAIHAAMKSTQPLSCAIVPDGEAADFKAFVQESKCVVVAEFGVSEHETMFFVAKK